MLIIVLKVSKGSAQCERESVRASQEFNVVVGHLRFFLVNKSECSVKQRRTFETSSSAGQA